MCKTPLGFPVEPSKIIAIGLNYKSHLGDRPGPKSPEPFIKAPNSVIGHGDEIIIPKIALEEKIKIQPEAELAVVIGKECKSATQSNALDYVFAYTCGNDVSGRDWQRMDERARNWAKEFFTNSSKTCRAPSRKSWSRIESFNAMDC